MKDKKFISESARMQKLAGLPINESMDYDKIDEMEDDLDEMARTAGTGGAYTVTDAGKEVLKTIKNTGELPAGIRASHAAILAYVLKKNQAGERVQKIDYAKEKGVPQPAVNPLFNQLEEKELITREGYEAQTKAPTSTRPRMGLGDLGLDDLDLD